MAEQAGKRTRKYCLENRLEPDQVAGFLRALADVIDGSCEDCLAEYGISLQDFNKLKLGLRKGDEGELALKIKVKERGAHGQGKRPRQQQATGSMEYKRLKKRLKGTFALLGRECREGAMPAADLVASFIEDSMAMISFPGFGDPHYAAYAKLCTDFAAAFERRDAAAVSACYAELAAMKKTCHQRYK